MTTAITKPTQRNKKGFKINLEHRNNVPETTVSDAEHDQTGQG